MESNAQNARVGGNPEVSIAGTSTDLLTIVDYFKNTRNKVEEFVYADGSVVTDPLAQGLVQAMAEFGASSPGEVMPYRYDTPAWRAGDLLVPAVW